MHAARTDIGRVHTGATGALVEHHQLFAFLETPDRRRHCADVHGLSRHVHDVRQDAADFRIKHADQLAAHRDFETQQLFDGERKSVFLVHRRDVVETVEIGNGLQIGLGLDQLFGAAMQKTDMRIDALDDFAVQLQNQTQHAVRGRMFRTEVDREIADVMLSHSSAPPR
ncbi:hypothetical protein D3C87_1106250 [compost metagenome]